MNAPEQVDAVNNEIFEIIIDSKSGLAPELVDAQGKSLLAKQSDEDRGWSESLLQPA